MNFDDKRYTSDFTVTDGRRTYKVVEVDLVKIFDEIYNEYRQLMNIKKIGYYFEVEPSCGVKIQAEPKLLKLALSNLLSNSCKYTDDNGEIVVKIEEAGDKVLISVADNGIGIKEGEKDKIFRDLLPLEPDKRKGRQGTGLGLSIVLNIIQKHHGQIRVESP